MNMDLSKYKNKQLKAFLQELKGKTSGARQELMLRLQSYPEDEVKVAIENVLQDDDMDVTINDSGEDTVATLKGEVATLNATVQMLVEKLQFLIPDSRTSGVTTESSERNDNLRVPPKSGHGSDTVAHVTNANVVGAQSDPVALGTHLQDIFTPETTAGLSNACNESHFHNQVTGEQSRNIGSNLSHGHTTRVVLVDDVGDNRHTPSNRTDVTTTNTIRGYSDIRDLTRLMPEFYPGRGISAKVFVERVEQLSRIHGWSDQMLIYAVYDQLKGPAKQWLNAMPVFHQWSEFVTAFTADFPSVVNSAELNMKMMRTKMNRNETYIDYFYKMLLLGRSGEMADAAIITYVINGLYDDTTRKILGAMQFPNCSSLLTTLTNLRNDKPQYSNTSNEPKGSQYARNFTKPDYHISRVVCYRCHERGHISKNCNKPRKPQDRINNINNAKQQDDCPPDVTEINNISQVSMVKELLQNIRIGGAESMACTALIDSGSGKSLIRRSLAERSKLPLIECDEKLIGFAGGVFNCRGKIKTEIKFNDSSYNAELLIIEDDKMPYEVIVGIDVLSQGTVIIEKGKCHVLPINVGNIDVESKLPVKTIDRFHETLQRYAHCFGEDIQELGRSRRFTMNIKLTTNKPVTRKPYPIPIPKQKVVEDIIEKLLENGIIQSSESAYSSPIVLVKKQNGEDRLCVDYRSLNAITEKQPWQMPTVDGVLATLAGKQFFTTLDLMSGYYQIEMDEESRQYTAFVTHNGHYEFRRMPFGLRNAPSAFQRMMTKLIEPLGKAVTSYVDEIIIATTTAEEGIDTMERFLKLVEEEGLTLRVSKCAFLKRSIKFLGHVVNENGIMPGTDKTDAIKMFPVPSNQHDLRRFLGLVGFFRKFVKDFALIAKPLSTLLKKNEKFQWTDDCQRSFQRLKDILLEAPVLTVYDPRKEHQLHTDASSIGVAGILLQGEDEGFKPIAYYSRTCTAAEQKYHAYELEVLAVVQACERFKLFLIGKHFTIVTDCQAITSAKVNKPLVPRVARWLLKLLEYDYTLMHRPGELMKHVDALSRAPITDDEEPVKPIDNIFEITMQDWVATLQQQDDKLKLKMDILSGKQQSNQSKQVGNEFCLQQHRLFRKADEGKKLLVVPKGIRWRIIKLCHDDAGHPGVSGTIKRAKEFFWFPRMTNFVKGYIKSCIDCSYHREPQRKEAELFGLDVPRLPFQVLHMDHLGPFCKTRKGNEHILVIVDALTRYTIITPVKSTKTKPVLDALNQLTLIFGLPQKIITDRGTAYTSGAFAEFCAINDIQHVLVAVRTPRANGLVERVNQAILQFLKPSTKDERDWDCELRQLQWTLNTKINTTTKIAAIDLIYDFPLRDLSGNKLLSALHDEANITMNSRREEAIRNIYKAREKWKERFDKKHRKPTKYREGDLVIIEAPTPSAGQSKKLHPVYRGPYQIKKVLRFDRYIVEDIDGIKNSQRRFSTVAACDKIKPWCALAPEIDDDYDDNQDSRDSDDY